MLLQETQRYAIECTVKIGKTPAESPNFTLDQLLPKLSQHVESNKAIHTTMGGRKTLIIKQIHFDEQKVVLLTQFADMDASDPSFTNTETGDTRTVNKEEGEGISVSAHLIISRKPISDVLNTVHNAILEEVPGISKTNLQAALNSILSDCTNFEFPNPAKKGSNLKCRPLIELDYNAGEKLQDLLKNGSVTGFVATKASAVEKLDEEGDLVATSERIDIKATKSRGNKALELIKKAKDAVSGKEFTKLMIRYEGDDKRSKTFEVCTREQNLGEKFFAKSYKMTLSEKVEQCQSTIHEDLMTKMLSLLNKMTK